MRHHMWRNGMEGGVGEVEDRNGKADGKNKGNHGMDGLGGRDGKWSETRGWQLE